ncbi:GspE/PulE family protein [bacterium]|nr:GspE/PulE family protein [bacterium]
MTQTGTSIGAKRRGARKRDRATAPDFDEFVKLLASRLRWIKEGAIVRFLAGDEAAARLIARLTAAGLIGDTEPDGSAAARLRTLLEKGAVDADPFVDFLRKADGFPLSHPQKGTFAEYLMERKLLSYDDLTRLLRVESEEGRRLEAIVAAENILPAARIYSELGRFLGIPFVEMIQFELEVRDLRAVPDAIEDQYDLMAARAERKILWVVSPRPIPEPVLDRLTDLVGRKVYQQLCPPGEFEHRREVYRKRKEEAMQTPVDTRPAPAHGLRLDRPINFAATSTVDLVAELVQRAVASRATDIHIEPRREGMNIRYRVDGFLYEVGRVDHAIGREIVSRIKILADMDITERRLPQDGHFRFSARAAEYDMRISTVPTNFGERMEIRLAEGGRVFTTIEDLGISPEEVKLIHGFIAKPHGIVLATGPVGSGKTTTLYSCISKIDKNKVNVMTIEDPIEYIIAGANQIEVNYRVNFDFVHGLRAILRQDPNVILVGEIRDEETARIAIRAGMTGMLVFSTLHANDAVGSVTTLANFQINRFLIANALVGSIAQRLVRMICPDCRKEEKIDEATREMLGLSESEAKSFTASRGAGCEACLHTGYRGRTGIFEIFGVTPELRSLVMSGASEEALRKQALQQGMRTLRDSGLAKVREGVTTIEEFIRVLG